MRDRVLWSAQRGARTEKGELGASLDQDSGVQVMVKWVASY